MVKSFGVVIHSGGVSNGRPSFLIGLHHIFAKKLPATCGILLTQLYYHVSIYYRMNDNNKHDKNEKGRVCLL